MKIFSYSLLFLLAFSLPSISAQETIISDCKLSLKIVDPYCVPTINYTFDFEVGNKFIDSIRGVTCEQLEKMRYEVYEQYLNNPSTSLYKLLYNRNREIYDKIVRKENELKERQSALTQEE